MMFLSMALTAQPQFLWCDAICGSSGGAIPGAGRRARCYAL